MPAKINIGDSWKSISAIKINIGDVWKTVTKGWVNIGDSWKVFYTSQTVTTYTYTTPGRDTLSIPADATQLVIECWGYGGAGSDITSWSSGGVAGGGGGGYSKTTMTNTADFAGKTADITVGASTYIAATLVNINSVDVCKAVKGGDGSGATPGSGAATTYAIGDVKYAGGNGGNRAIDLYSGGGGEGACTTGNGNNASGKTGGSGCDGGDGAKGIDWPYGSNGNTGTAPGGGGSGAFGDGTKSTFYGGKGGNGQVKITVTVG